MCVVLWTQSCLPVASTHLTRTNLLSPTPERPPTTHQAEQKVITFANTLSNALKVNTDYQLIELVAAALGDMARSSPMAQVDYVESELNQALDWLRESQERSDQSQSHRRFAACAVLQQLAENAPTVFFVRTKEFFDLIWKPLRGRCMRRCMHLYVHVYIYVSIIACACVYSLSLYTNLRTHTN